MLRKKAGEIMNTRVCAVSFYMLKHLELQSCNRKTTITHNNFRHCHVRFSSFVRQPFSKQLYINLKVTGARVAKCTLPSYGSLWFAFCIVEAE